MPPPDWNSRINGVCVGFSNSWSKTTWPLSYLHLRSVLFLCWGRCEMCHGIQNKHMSRSWKPNYRSMYSPTQTRPSRPTAIPAIHSQRKDPSVLEQWPFMHMPGVSHSSMSRKKTQQKWFPFTKWTVKRQKSIQTNRYLAKVVVDLQAPDSLKSPNCCTVLIVWPQLRKTFFSRPLIPSAYYNNYHNERKQRYGMHA